MKSIKRPVSVLLSILMITSIFTALPVTASADTAYTITWLKQQYWTLKTTTVPEGETPVYDGDTPSKDPNDVGTYEFSGWEPEIVPATQDATYTAKFTMKFNDENIVDGGMILGSSSLYWAVTKDETDDTKHNLKISSINESDAYSDFPMPEFDSPENVPWKAYKDSIVSVFFSQNVSSISSYAFQDFTALETVEFQYNEYYHTYAGYSLYGVDSIGDYAFAGCTSLSNVPLGMVKSIGQYAFAGCTSLSYTDISSVYTLDQHAFEGCALLSSVLLMNCTNIGDYAFNNCTSLESVGFSDALTQISMGAFTNCTSLASVNLPQYFKRIEENAFEGCSALNNMILPSNVEYIGNNAFLGCSGMTDIYLYADPDDSSFTWECGSGEFIVTNTPEERTKLHVVSGRSAEYSEALGSELNALIVDDADTNIESWRQLQFVMNASSAVTLQNDLTAAGNDTCLSVESGKELTIDLNGHTLNRGRYNGYNPYYTSETFDETNTAILNNGTLTVIDSSDGQTGKITGASASGIVNKGTFTLRGGSITANCGAYGRGINNDYCGVTNIYGGKITNNRAYEITDTYFE